MSSVEPGTRVGIEPAEAIAIADRLRPALPPALGPVFDASFVRSHHLYEEFVRRLALRVFREMGLEPLADADGSVEAIAARAGLDPDRVSVPLGWILRHLARWGVLERVDGDGPRFRLRRPCPTLDPAPVLEAQRHHDASWLPSYVLAETVARDYPAFLRGEAAGEAILFSPGRLSLWVNYFSNDNGLYAVNNRVGALALEQWLPREGASILELGGGLASGALAALERLEAAGMLPGLRGYHFTEFVPAFLRRGQRVLEQRFPGAPCLTFGPLDMNRSFAAQDIARRSVSVVYAVNTLHVAHDLEATLGEIRESLVPGGQVVVSECVRPAPDHTNYAEFVFNLMETFRAPRLDPRYRPNGGFLTPEQWRRAFAAAGFVDVRFLPDLRRVLDEVADFSVAAVGATRPG